MGEEVNSPKADSEEDLSYLFTLDNNPSHISDDLDIPVYSSKFQVLKEKEEVVEEEKKPARPRGVTCWNCEGEHNLRDCTQPRNFALIAQKRANLQTKYGKQLRYHTDEEQKYPNLRPGKISQRLRDALGLRPDQAPQFVYKMRQLGYPPGWVEEARVSHSGLSMFDSVGQEVKDPDLEDGEIVAQGDRDKYDFRKLIEYPGFNVPFESGTTDETDYYRAHPMKESQSVQHMLNLWSGKRMSAYRRKRLKVQSSSNTNSPSISSSNIPPEEEDMELDAEQEELKFLPPNDQCGFIPPLPDCTPCQPPPPPTPESSSETEKSSQSPAKGVKRKLVSDDDSPPGEEDNNKSINESKISDDSPTSTLDGTKSLEFASPAEPYNGRVKSVCSGTPVITRSEFKYLPSPENFSKDICDVINFENLPNSTGKYEQMHGLIAKVRTYVTQSLSKADDEEDE